MTPQMLRELPVALDRLLGLGARAIVVHSIGVSKNFCAGLSIESLAESASSTRRQEDGGCQARRRWHFREYITKLQDAMTLFEACRVPVIAGVHGACVGAGVDLITACDVRLCTASASFCVKEVDLGIVADMGTLSRLPGIVGDGIARQLSLTAETIDGTRAKEVCLVSDALPTDERLLEAAMAMARGIAAKSPLAVAGTKEVLLYVREHGRVEDGLAYVATLNAGILPENEDVALVMERVRGGGGGRFSKL
jgi:enoyl-CoA hydratase/carnithine racemase